MSDLDLEIPKRQSPVGVAVIFFKKLRVAINIFISIAVVQFGFQANLSSLWFIGIVGFVLLAVFATAYLTYRKFYFYVAEGNFIIEKGLVRRDKVSVPFDRIQSVHINQNIIQRILGVVGLKIDTAGSAIKELEIAALPKSYARSLQEYLMAQKEVLNQVESKSLENELATEKNIEAETTSEKKALVQLSVKDIFKIGFTENHLRTGLFLFAIVNGYVWQYEEYLLKPFKPFLENNAEYLSSQWLILAPIAILLFLIISILLSLIQSFLKYYNLQFFVHKNGLQLVSGLLKKVEYQIPINKIQFIKWTSNPLRKLIGLKTIVVKQAGSNEAGDQKSLKVPGSTDDQIDVVLAEFYKEQYLSEFKGFKSHPFFKVQVFLVMGLLPSIPLLILGEIDIWLLVISPLWLILSIPFAIRYADSMKIECNKDMIKFSRGYVFPKVMMIKYYKLQNLKINQNVFQKNKNTVHVDFYTAAGNIRMWQLDKKVAQELYNYTLYKIESSRESWM